MFRPVERGAVPDTTSYRPIVFDPASADGARALAALLEGPSAPIVHDTLADQLLELVASLNPSDKNT